MTSVFASFLAGRGAKMLDIGPDCSTPRSFSDPRREHLAVRRDAGLFDFSFMGCLEIAGRASLDFLHSVQSRALASLPAGRIAYTLLLREDGTVLNDATVWRLGQDRYCLFTGRRADVDDIKAGGSGSSVTLDDTSRQHAVIAVQGRSSWRAIERCFGGRAPGRLPYYGFERLHFAGNDCWLARIGYSGEAGYELVTTDAAAPALWQALLAAGEDCGLLECGFDATNSLRIEAGHLLFTRELSAPVTPFELGFARLVDFYHGAYRGMQCLRAQRWSEPRRKLVGLLPFGSVAEAESLPEDIPSGRGVLTSACWSPVCERCLGLGFVSAGDASPGTSIKLHDGTRARVARLPFYDPAKFLARRTR